MRRRGESSDREAFAAVFEAHRDEVVRLAYLLCGDGEVARDAAAEAFARTYQQWRRGRVDRVEGYVRRAVVNHVNSYFRRLGRQRRVEQRAEGDARRHGAVGEQVATTEQVRTLLRQLPARQRTAVVLRYWEDLSDTEVAEAMDCPVGTAKSLLARGLARLREATELDDAHQEVAGNE